MVELVCSVRLTMNNVSKYMRARVLETLTLIATQDAQLKYQRDAPHVDVPAELFNQWEDCYFPGDDNFRGGFVAEELEILSRFDEMLKQICEETPQELPDLEEFIKTIAWRKLSVAAREALSGLRS